MTEIPFTLMMVALCLVGLAMAITAALTQNAVLRTVLVVVLFGSLAILKHSGVRF